MAIPLSYKFWETANESISSFILDLSYEHQRYTINMTKDFWDERYSKEAYAYGEQPNEFLKNTLPGFPAGTILFPADGEGRNSVFAATLGWQVSSFDLSSEGKRKAEKLAAKNNVNIDYQVCELEKTTYQPQQFDAIGLFFAHFPAEKKWSYHKILDSYLKPNGIIFFEAYSKNQIEFQKLNPSAGGPKDINMLFSTDEIIQCFPNYEIIELKETLADREEGQFHNGNSALIQFVGRKK